MQKNDHGGAANESTYIHVRLPTSCTRVRKLLLQAYRTRSRKLLRISLHTHPSSPRHPPLLADVYSYISSCQHSLVLDSNVELVVVVVSPTLCRAGPMREIKEIDECLHVTSRQNFLADTPPIHALEILISRLVARQPCCGILLRRGEAVTKSRLALGRTCSGRHGGYADRLHLIDRLGNYHGTPSTAQQ